MPQLIRNIAILRALLADTDRFGGWRDGEPQRGDFFVLGDRVIDLTQSPPATTRVLNGAGRLVLPGLIEPHLHLDKAFTLPRLPQTGGDPIAAIAAQEAE